MQQHVETCGLGYKDVHMGVYGRRCSAVVLDLWYEPISKVFHLKEKPGRFHAQMIQNAKKSFYVRD